MAVDTLSRKTKTYPVINCPAGKLRGWASEGVERYFGVPYAAPPIGLLRFSPCKPLVEWSEELDATCFGRASAQVFDPKEAAFEEYGEESPDSKSASRRWVGSEDSLTLNIWRSAGGGLARPVIIWIHGGANWLESSRLGYYDGTHLALQGTVFVSFNYRLGVFGFLDLSPIGGPASAHSNGLTDQLAAIQWVVSNIAAFGGDPNNITLMGNSAGSMDISWHIASGRLPPGVKRVIMSSGVASASGLGRDGGNCTHDPIEGQRRSAELLRDMGFGTFASLQAAATGEILTRQAEAWKPVAGLPPMDTLFYPRTGPYSALDPFDAVAAGAGKSLEVMIGYTAYEMGLWLAWDDAMDQRSPEWAAAHVPFVPEEIRAELPRLYRQWFPGISDGRRAMHMIGDVVFELPSHWFADLLAANGSRVHAYRFDWAADERFGALHCADIAFFLGNQDAPAATRIIGSASSDTERFHRNRLMHSMVSAVSGFAATGTPIVFGTTWPAYTSQHRDVMLFNSTNSVRRSPLGERGEWWTNAIVPTELRVGS